MFKKLLNKIIDFLTDVSNEHTYKQIERTDTLQYREIVKERNEYMDKYVVAENARRDLIDKLEKTQDKLNSANWLISEYHAENEKLKKQLNINNYVDNTLQNESHILGAQHE